VKAKVYNPAKQRAWTLEDAKERWEEVSRSKTEIVRKAAFSEFVALVLDLVPESEKQLMQTSARRAAHE
jgi:hypothetical protein